MPKRKEPLSEEEIAAITLETKLKTEVMYAIQKARIAADLRIQAFVRDKRMTEVKAKALHMWLSDMASGMEKHVNGEVRVLLKDVPIYNRWLVNVYGVSTALSGSLIAGIGDISRFEKASSLWKYCGLDVIHWCDTCHMPAPPDLKVTTGDVCPMCRKGEFIGEAPRRMSGQKIHWSPFLRSTVYKITESIVRAVRAPEKNFYRKLYEERKARHQEEHPECRICYKCGAPLVEHERVRVKKVNKKTGKETEEWYKKQDECPTKGCKGNHGGSTHPFRKTKAGDPLYRYSKGHIHRMAKRYMGKVFMLHLWLIWRSIEGLPISGPWIIEHGGHIHFTQPPHWEPFDIGKSGEVVTP